MADQSDVEKALVNVVSAALYPSGTAAASVPGPDCRIYRGWPNSAALDADLAAGNINVTVFPGERRQPHHNALRRAMDRRARAADADRGVDGTTVIFGGTAEPVKLPAFWSTARATPTGHRAGDTPQSVAANLATMARERFDRAPVTRHADDSRRRRSAGAGGRGCRGATGGSPAGAGLSRDLLVPDTSDPRRDGKPRSIRR